jgi:hypothetical protein
MKRTSGRFFLAALACAGCATAVSWRPAPGTPATFALLLNGGGLPNINCSYAIPVDGVLDEQTRHLKQLRDQLNAARTPGARHWGS